MTCREEGSLVRGCAPVGLTTTVTWRDLGTREPWESHACRRERRGRGAARRRRTWPRPRCRSASHASFSLLSSPSRRAQQNNSNVKQWQPFDGGVWFGACKEEATVAETPGAIHLVSIRVCVIEVIEGAAGGEVCAGAHCKAGATRPHAHTKNRSTVWHSPQASNEPPRP